MKFRTALAVAFAGLALTACAREQTPPREDAAPADLNDLLLTGVHIVGLSRLNDPLKQRITIELHEH